MQKKLTRRAFLGAAGIGASVMLAHADDTTQHSASSESSSGIPETSIGWEPFSDRKLRLGLIGFGVCQYAAAFQFEKHPNVEVTAVSDLFPDRR